MSKEHAYAYEAGYKDGSTYYELEHCPACKNVTDLQEALDENAKLRDEFHKMDVWHSKELVAAMDENAKLRELAADMLRAMRRMEESAGMDALVGHSAWFAPKLHELGIEVDE